MGIQAAIAPHPAGDAGPALRLGVVAGLMRNLARTSDPKSAVRQGLAEIRSCLGAEAVAVFLWDERDDFMISLANDRRVESGTLGADFVALMREATIDDFGGPHRNGGFARCFERQWGLRVRSLMWFPLRCGHEASVGAVFAINAPDGRDFGPGDADVLQSLADALALAIGNNRVRGMVDQMNETHRELELAAAIQRNLLPTPDPLRSPVQGLNRPARKVSGDFFDYLKLANGLFPFALGDVSGKGMNAALMMSKTASLFHCLAKTIDDPAELLRALNQEIRETAAHGMFVTMLTGVYNPVSGVIRFANAGHVPPLLRLPDRSYREFLADAPPIGILEDLEPATVEIDIAGGEFYVFSDGLTEFAHEDGEMLGVAGLIQMVEVSTNMPLSQRLDSVLALLDAEGWSAHDDLTVLTIDGAWVPRDG